MTHHPLADNAAGTRLERWFNTHPRLTTAGAVAFVLLLQIVGALLDA